jgi:acid phosphatase family membrane protein YuiD
MRAPDPAENLATVPPGENNAPAPITLAFVAPVPRTAVIVAQEIAAPAPVNRFRAEDVAAILLEHGLLDGGQQTSADAALVAWLARAAELLGPQSPDRESLAALLALIFSYDAAAIFRATENQAVLAREGAREVIRELAGRVLEGSDVDSDRFKEIIDAMKMALPYRGRALFHPIRLALAGRPGEGEFDRVILLLDVAAKIPFAAPVKGTRRRMLEFCFALD